MIQFLEKGCYFLITMCVLASCQSTVKSSADAGKTAGTSVTTPVAEPLPVVKPPAKVAYLGKSKGEAPYRDFHLDVTLTNHRTKPVWFITRYYGDVALPSDNMFTSVSNKILQFASFSYDGTTSGGKGSVVKVTFIGKKKFIAFHMQPKTTLRIRDLVIPSTRRFKEFEVWEADKVFVNSRRDLSRWLPYSTFSTKDADIRKGSQFKKLDLKPNGTEQRDDYPRGGIDNIWVMPLHKWNIEIDGI